MNKTPLYLLLISVLVALNGCVDPYEPNLKSSQTDILVVEGSINGGGFSTTLVLSRTIGLDQEISHRPETGATVRIEGDNGFNQMLTETEDGSYTGTLNLDQQEKYRLYIQTSNGLEYVSDYSTVLITPEIDSISWKQHDNYNVSIYANTHDPNNNTWYYRWEYDEDWEFTAPLFSNYLWVNNQLVERTRSENVYYCWNKRKSTQVNISNSTSLGKDVIFEHPIQGIEQGDQVLSYMYRIRVRQYALSSQAYQFWYDLQKNTESGNDLFAPLPSVMHGNITCLSDASIPVTGFVEACIPTTAERYIQINELKFWNMHFSPYCIMTLEEDRNPYSNLMYISDIEGINLKILGGYMIITDGEVPNTVWVMLKHCGDCTLSGTKDKPVDWPTTEL